MSKLDLAVDVVDTISVRFQNGALANVSASGLLPSAVGSFGMQILGDKGAFFVDSIRQTARLWSEGASQPRLFELPPRLDVFTPVPCNFARAILGEEPIQVAIDTVRILDAAYRSAASGQAVEIR